MVSGFTCNIIQLKYTLNLATCSSCPPLGPSNKVEKQQGNELTLSQTVTTLWNKFNLMQKTSDERHNNYFKNSLLKTGKCELTRQLRKAQIALLLDGGAGKKVTSLTLELIWETGRSWSLLSSLAAGGLHLIVNGDDAGLDLTSGGKPWSRPDVVVR